MPAMADRRAILFLCMGNICRSPAGEGVMRHLVAERGLVCVELPTGGSAELLVELGD